MWDTFYDVMFSATQPSTTQVSKKYCDSIVCVCVQACVRACACESVLTPLSARKSHLISVHVFAHKIKIKYRIIFNLLMKNVFL